MVERLEKGRKNREGLKKKIRAERKCLDGGETGDDDGEIEQG